MLGGRQAASGASRARVNPGKLEIRFESETELTELAELVEALERAARG